MTGREFRLRQRIDDVTAERDAARLDSKKLRTTINNLVGQRKRALVGRCVYCGVWCKGKACPSHRDLVQIDPGMGAVPGEAMAKRAA